MTDELICPICGKDVFGFLDGKFDCSHGAKDMVDAVNEARAWARKMKRRALEEETRGDRLEGMVDRLAETNVEQYACLCKSEEENAALRRKLEESEADNFIQSACLNKQSDLITELRQENAHLRRLVDILEATEQKDTHDMRCKLRECEESKLESINKLAYTIDEAWKENKIINDKLEIAKRALMFYSGTSGLGWGALARDTLDQIEAREETENED